MSHNKSDKYMAFANSALGNRLTSWLGLPQPIPLRRFADNSQTVSPIVFSSTENSPLQAALIHQFEQLKRVVLPAAQEPSSNLTKVSALVFDASALANLQDLEQIYTFFHNNVKRLHPHGRVLIIGLPPEQCSACEQRIIQRSLEGLVRSLGKELHKNIACQLIYVAEVAKNSLGSTLDFFLSTKSAYVSGQVVRVIQPSTGQVDPAQILAKQSILVTGAARGIGASIAQTMADFGANVVCLDVPQAQAALEKTARRIGAQALSLDITAANAGTVLIDYAKQHGAFDVLVHNAGITRDKTIAKMSNEAWDLVMAVNLTAPLRLTQQLLEQGQLNKGARVVCVSSISGIAGNLGQTNYAVSKAGVIGMVDALADNFAKQGMSINAVAPGFIETQMTAQIPMMIRQAGRRMNSMGQGGQPEDVAQTIAWLARADSLSINGQTVRVCGQSLLGA